MTDAESNHPSDDALRAFYLGQLGEADLSQVSVHLEGCPACLQRVDFLAADDRLLTRLKQSGNRKKRELVNRAQRRLAVRALEQGKETRAAGQEGGSGAGPVAVAAPKQIGDYDVLCEVGRGGMGVVYKARHRGLNRLAALKMILTGEFASPTQELRFRLEAELAARVEHPNIVHVYEVGSYECRPFLALEWVEGGSLASKLDGTPWPPGQAAALIETLARAIDVAHAEGVVHRDLKPANILLAGKSGGSRVEGSGRTVKRGGWRVEGENGDSDLSGDPSRPDGADQPNAFGIPQSSSEANLTSLGGPRSTLHPSSSNSHSPPAIPHAKITDFGLAHQIEGGQTVTQSGLLVGTPGYMAPEQAAGKRALIGPATDIYALGVMLYELLTGQLPFRGDTTLELLRAVALEEPILLRRLQPRVPRDLEAVTLHCLEKEPRNRYASALALAEDLQRFREGKQVAARPVGAVGRLARACRRKPVITLLVGLLTISLFAGLGGVTWKWLDANEQRDLANAHAKQADTEKREAQYQAYRASLYAARAATENHDVADAAGHLEAAPEGLRGWEWRHLSSGLDDSSSVVRLPDQGPGFLLAAPDQLGIGVFTSAGLRITDLDGNERGIVPIGPEQRRLVSVAQTRRGVRIAAWVDNTAFELLDDAGQVVCRVATPENKDYEPAPVTVSPDGRWLACRTDGAYHRFAVFDAITGKQAAICNGHSANINALAFSPDSTRVVSGSVDRTARLWDAATGKLLVTFQGHASTVESTRFSPDGSRLLTASADGTVRQWDVRTCQPVGPPYTGHSGALVTAAYSPDGQFVASAGEDRVIRVWRAMDQQDVALLYGHTWQVFELAFDPSGRRLASRSDRRGSDVPGDGTVRVWDVDPQATLPVLRGHTAAIYPVAYSPDGRWLASGSSDRTVRLWDAATGEPCAILPHPGDVRGLAFGPDGTRLITGNMHGGRLRIWDVVTARVRKEILLHGEKDRFRSLTLSADGTRVAATTEAPMLRNRRLTVIDIESGKSLFAMDGIDLAYSPDGRWLAVVGPDSKTVMLLDAQTHATAARFLGHEGEVQKAAFSPDGRTLATCSLDRTVRLWPLPVDGWGVAGEHSSSSTRDPAPSAVLRGHTDAVYAVTFHPDGTRLATAARDGAVWLWDFLRGKEVARLQAHSGFVWSLAFTPDGATLASGFGNTTIRLWDTAPLKARYQARREASALRPEAERLVDRLWREKSDPADVVAALRADHMLSEKQQHAALRAVLRRSRPPEAGAIKPRAVE